MLKVLALMLSLTLSVNAVAATELVFIDEASPETLATGLVEGGKWEVSSTVDAPIATGWLVAAPVCFNGDANDVDDIINAMIAKDKSEGVEYYTFLSTYSVVPDETLVGEPLIVKNVQIAWKEKNKSLTYTVNIRPCSRKTKP